MDLAAREKTRRRIADPRVEVVVIDQDSSAIDEASLAGLRCGSGDATDAETHCEFGLAHVSTLVSTFSNETECVSITLAARDLNQKICIIARQERESAEKKLLQVGADTIVVQAVVVQGKCCV